jgi:predicted nuclease with TOPRIM domain
MSSAALNIYIVLSSYQGNHIALFVVLGALIAFSLSAMLIAVNQFRKDSAEIQKYTVSKPDKKLETIVRHYDELAERHIALAQQLEDAKKQNTELIKKLESSKTFNNENNHKGIDAGRKQSDLDEIINDIKDEQSALSKQVSDLSDRIRPIEKLSDRLIDILNTIE